MTSYKTDQRHLSYRGRTFHFVAYEGHPANAKRQEPAIGPMWFLMGPGKRWPVMPQVADQALDDIDHALRAWLDRHVFA
jgi:hypothetical protein